MIAFGVMLSLWTVTAVPTLYGTLRMAKQNVKNEL
jgi:hypothetical protein